MAEELGDLRSLENELRNVAYGQIKFPCPIKQIEETYRVHRSGALVRLEG